MIMIGRVRFVAKRAIAKARTVMPVLSTELVAQRLGVSQDWVRVHKDLFMWWELKPGRSGKEYRFAESSVDSYIERRKSPRTLAGIIQRVKEENHVA